MLVRCNQRKSCKGGILIFLGPMVFKIDIGLIEHYHILATLTYIIDVRHYKINYLKFYKK
jgi:hypothetical protein